MLPIEYLISWILRLLRRRRREHLETEALDWPSALGTVVDARPKVSDGGEPYKNWTLELVYAYVATGEYHSGTHLLAPESEDEVTEEADRWKERKLVVRYSPEDASRSVVLLQDQASAAITALERAP